MHRSLHRTLAFLLGMLLATAGCVEKSKRRSKADEQAAAKLKLSQRPTPKHPLDIEFETKIKLLGYDLSHTPVREGEPFTVTWYWEVREPLGDGWMAFTHLADGEKRNRINLDATRMVRRVYPAAQWKKGDFIKDAQEVTLPEDWDSPAATFFLGFYNGPHRLHVTRGKNDGDNRAQALTVPVSGGKKAAEPTLPRLVAQRAETAPTLDGKLDEKAWTSAQRTAPLVNTMTGEKAEFKAGVRTTYDAEHIYFGFEVADTFIQSKFTKDDEHLWNEDCVEMLIDPDGDGKNYFEVQVSPVGKVFDTKHQSPRKPRPFGEVTWNSEAKAKVVVEGKANDDDEDTAYVAEIALPWKALVDAPPKAGDVWRVNFFVMDTQEDGQRAAGWSPPKVGDFHVTKRFGRLAFMQDAVPGTPNPTPVLVKQGTSPEASKPEAAKPEAAKPEAAKAEAPAKPEAAKPAPAAKPATPEATAKP